MKGLFKKLFAFFWDKSLLSFAIIGAANTVLSMVGSQLLLRPFTALWGAAGGYWGSTAIMYAVASVLSFVLNRRFSFNSKAPLKKSIPRFAIVIAVCYLISFSLSDLIVPWALGGLAPALDAEWVTRIAMLVAQVIFTACNYIGQRLYAFKD